MPALGTSALVISNEIDGRMAALQPAVAAQVRAQVFLGKLNYSAKHKVEDSVYDLSSLARNNYKNSLPLVEIRLEEHKQQVHSGNASELRAAIFSSSSFGLACVASSDAQPFGER